MADPEFLPAMNPLIQKACRSFSEVANDIIRRNGLYVEEFNDLQEKVERNAFYRFRVQNEIRKLEKKGDF